MAQVTEPGEFHTAGSAHLEGIDFAGKTGTAEVMGHEALVNTAKGHTLVPNVWFVGVTPRRNPDWWSRCFGRTANSAIIPRASAPSCGRLC